jgi:ribosomal protein S27E
MTTAIVTITCPSCGGKIEGITATNADQTIKCTYCGTELHVPRVGEVIHEVVHEVIREVPSEPVYIDPGTPDLRKKMSTTPALIAVAVFTVVLIPIYCSQRHDADTMLDDFHRQDQRRAACKAACVDSCKGSRGSADPDTDPRIQQTMQDANRSVCESQCEIDQDCYK